MVTLFAERASGLLAKASKERQENTLGQTGSCNRVGIGPFHRMNSREISHLKKQEQTTKVHAPLD